MPQAALRSRPVMKADAGSVAGVLNVLLQTTREFALRHGELPPGEGCVAEEPAVRNRRAMPLKVIVAQVLDQPVPVLQHAVRRPARIDQEVLDQRAVSHLRPPVQQGRADDRPATDGVCLVDKCRCAAVVELPQVDRAGEKDVIIELDRCFDKVAFRLTLFVLSLLSYLDSSLV